MWAALLKQASGVAKKKVKKKGADMAKNIVNKKEKDNSRSIVIRKKSTSIVQLPGGDIVKQDSSAQKPKSGSSPLDRIDSALLDIINTLKSRRKLMLAQSRRDRVQANKEKKGKREGLLEKKKGGKKMLGNVKQAAAGWWERLQRFLLMTMLGALVLSIKNNWEAIQEKIKETVEFVKELWENLEPILTPIWKGLKWIVKWAVGPVFKKLIKVSADMVEVKKGTDEVSKGLEELDEKTKWASKLFKDAANDIKSIKDTDIDTLKVEVEEDETNEETMTLISSAVASEKEKINIFKDENKIDKFDKGAVPVVETGPAIVHKGEVIVPAPIVQMAGGPINIQNVINMMSSSTEKIKKNPLKVISIMEGLAQEFAPIGEQLPGIINETIGESKIGGAPAKILEKMEKTLTILKEQTGYEDPSGQTIMIPLPTPSQPSASGGNGGGTTLIPIGPSSKAALNKYIETVIQGALY